VGIYSPARVHFCHTKYLQNDELMEYAFTRSDLLHSTVCFKFEQAKCETAP